MRIESCHPGVIALYFAAMLAFTGWFQQPVFLALSLGTAVVVTGFLFRDGLWKRLGWTATAGGVVFLWAALFCRFGDTVLWGELWGNPVTLEGLVYSATPNLSGLAERKNGLREGLRRESMVLTWALDSLGGAARSMTCRGYSLRHRTSYACRWMGHGDRVLLTVESWGIVILLCGWALNQTRAWYDPVLVVNQITPVSVLFYVAYLVFALLPVELELLMALSRRRDQRRMARTLEGIW